MGGKGGSTCYRCGRGLSVFAAHCPACGLATAGAGRVAGALPALLAGGSLAAAGVLARALLAAPLAEAARAGWPLAWLLAGPPAAAASTAPLSFAFGGGALAGLVLAGLGPGSRVLLGLGVSALGVAALAVSSELDPSRAVLMAALAVLGAGLGSDLARWLAARLPFRWLADACRPLPWPARALAVAASLAALLLGAPWLLAALLALGLAAGARGVPVPAPDEAAVGEGTR